ncbi:MAG TPA: hypothetical protein PLL30_01835 [Candidatus Krumholzibacteria bacterium]|nr:hypothetical protein [Candidatus Krumholzibacteria bacterium]HPD70506.1 hypothetical protein [Candidatus Krumholzibacteria bacterium]HRY39794.1 hypothetical protein [Candidatus Krumholzibacteria bacterium]
MSAGRFIKVTCLGCLAAVALLVVVVGVALLAARQGLERQRIEDAELAAGDRAAGALTASAPGRVVLDLSHGEFYVHPAGPGEGLLVKARFDHDAYALSDSLEILPDSTWVYRVEYRRTISGLQSILRSLLGGGNDSRVDVFLPPDLPIALEVRVRQGGAEAQLGGLWLTDAVIDFGMGGFALDIAEPLREPLEQLVIGGHMGGFEATGLGNASPRRLAVDCKMGGADLDLGGEWLRDCDVRLSVDMGGMNVEVPAGLDVQGVIVDRPHLRPENPEVALPVLRVTTQANRGEIEFTRR